VKAIVTGGTGFVGSNIVRVFQERHGVDVLVPTNSFVPAAAAYRHEPCDLTDGRAVDELVGGFHPDVIVHAAILNDFGALYRDRSGSWDSYVGTTRNIVSAANAVGAKVIVVSTDL